MSSHQAKSIVEFWFGHEDPMQHSKLWWKKDPELYKDVCQGAYKFAVKHAEIVFKYGRYPHRNEILGRASTDEEIKFLKGPGSSF